MQQDLTWNDIDTVILDMDGTLLDLAFDSYFWLQLVPQQLSAEREREREREISLSEAKRVIDKEYHAVQHTLNWYCFDYWSERLGLDIYQMTSEIGSCACLRADTEPFLTALGGKWQATGIAHQCPSARFGGENGTHRARQTP